MTWQQRDPTTFEKPIGPTELPFCFFALLGQEREHWAIHSVAHVQLAAHQDPETVFRDAWTALRFDLPDLYVTHDLAAGVKEYVVLDDDALREWLDQTFRVEHGHPHAESLVASMRRSPLTTCHLIDQGEHDGSRRATIVINCSHSKIDGFGAFHVMNRLLHLASRGPVQAARGAAAEVARLRPNFEELVRKRLPSSEETAGRVAGRLGAFFSSLPSAGFPPDDPSPAGGAGASSAMVRISSAAATSALVNACRSKGISVTAAVQSALAVLVYQRASEPVRARKLAIVTPADVRQRIPVLRSGDDHAAGIFMGALYSTTTADAGFLERAKALGEDYALANSAQWLAEDVSEVSVQVGNALKAGMPTPPEAPSHPMCSSFGVVDRIVAHEHGAIRVLDVRVGTQVLTPENVLHVWTFRGQLHLSFNYNTAYYRDATIAGHLHDLYAILAAELGVAISGTPL